jgi:hypothetical protein
MGYLSELYEAVAEVDARVSEMDEDHGELLLATRQALTLAQEFALEECHRVTARVDAHSAGCGDRASALRSAAAAVGALLQRALTG